MVKIYRLNDCDWMAAETLDGAIQEWVKNYGGDREILEDEQELIDEEMDRLRFTDMDDPLVPENGMRTYTFREALRIMLEQGKKAPFFFASTEY